jgi:hypothetical protein
MPFVSVCAPADHHRVVMLDFCLYKLSDALGLPTCQATRLPVLMYTAVVRAIAIAYKLSDRAMVQQISHWNLAINCLLRLSRALPNICGVSATSRSYKLALSSVW